MSTLSNTPLSVARTKVLGSLPARGVSRSAERSQSRHIPALDGIRGLAILLVLCYHFTMIQTRTAPDRAIQGFYSLTWSGVDLFFVLSGLLITGILYDAKGTDGYFRNFYIRRTLRIFPLYYAFLFLMVVVRPMFGATFADRFHNIGGSSWPYWLYLSNFAKIFRDGHLGSDSLGITWSLAIEEQFYLLWPTVVLLCSRKTLMRVCVGLMVAAVLTRVGLVAFHADWETIYNFTPARMEPLAIGALIALMLRGEGIASLLPAARRLLWITPLVLCTMIAAHHRVTWGPDLQIVGFSLFSLFYGSIVVLTLAAVGMTSGSDADLPAATDRLSKLLNRVLTSDGMIMLGKYSYAIYLFNQPVKVLVRDFVFSVGHFPTLMGSEIPGQIVYYWICGSTTLALAWLSWHGFEKHCLKLKRFFPMGKRPEATVVAQPPRPVPQWRRAG